MTLLLTLPDNCRAERLWISSILLTDFLGLQYEVRFDGVDAVWLSAAGKSVKILDAFFACANSKWLRSESLPSEPLARWIIDYSDLDPNLVEPTVPVLFGVPGFRIHDNGDATLNLDIFGSAFFMLSRYEEAVKTQRDDHDRFPANASLGYRENILDRPIIDEYVEILWAAMKRLWPQLERKPRKFKTVVTCDVDHPYDPSGRSLLGSFRKTAREVIRKRTFSSAVNPFKNYFASRNLNWRHDPYYYKIDWMMDVNEKAGNKVAFYFIPEITHKVLDANCSITDSAVTAMLNRIAQRGHEIGIHPGYNTYLSKENIISGRAKLQRLLDRERISQEIIGGRQHYLRWSTQTPAIWDAAGLQYDSTLSYADYAGFRCGTCHEYAMYDLHRRTALKLKQRPLICMERSVIDYMKYGLTKNALVKMKQLKSVVQRFNGNFVLLWHNSGFDSSGAMKMYCDLIL